MPLTQRPCRGLHSLNSGAAILLLLLLGVLLGSQVRAQAVATPDARSDTVQDAGNNAVTLPVTVVDAVRLGTTPFDTSASVDIIDGADMRAFKPGINLSEGLAGVAGLQIQNRQNYAQDLQISIRGFGARSTFGVRGLRIYVDGIPATMPDGQAQTSNIDIASIDHVEVLRGPFSALYGNSSGGVLQIYTQDGTPDPTISATASGGSYGTWRYGMKATGTRDGLDYVVSASRFTTQGYREHSGAQKNLANAKLGWQLDDKTHLTIIANSVDLAAQDPMGLTRAQYDTDPRGVASAADSFNTRKTVRQTQGGLIFDRTVDADNSFRLVTYYGQRDTTQYQSIPVATQAAATSPGGVIVLNREYAGLDARWTSRLSLAGSPLTLVGGFSYDTLTEQRQGYDNYTSTPQGLALGEKGLLRRDETNRVYNADPYLQASWKFLPRWTLDTAVRYSTVDFDSNDYYITQGNGDDSGGARYRKALPTVSLGYEVVPSTRLYVSYGRGFETPTLNEISYRPDGQPGLNFGLRPAVSNNLEAGVKTRALGGLATLAAFHTRTENEILVDTSAGGRSTYRNAGATTRDGVELSWRRDLGANLQATLAYSYVNARYRDTIAGSAIVAGNRIPGIGASSAFASLAWAPPTGWQASIEERYLSRVYVDDANDDAAPAYAVTGAAVGYVWRKGAWTTSSFVRVDNLFDRKYAGSVIVNDGNGRYFEPAPGRNWTAGLSVSVAL